MCDLYAFSTGRQQQRSQLKVLTVDDGQFSHQQHSASSTTTAKSTQQRSVSVGSPFQSHGAPSVTDHDGGVPVKGDESLPWRRPKPTKMRSRSLQPGGVQRIEDLPWLRQRDRSFSRQEQPMLYGRDKHPIRPWIEEVICLKRTELRRKIVEKAALEKVLLKASQIERKEIIRAQIVEHIDLKSVQKYFERGNFANLEEAQVAMEEELIQQYEEENINLQHIKHEEDLSILELTKEIDALVRKDYEQKSQTLVQTERVSRKQTANQIKSTQHLQQQQQQQQEQTSHATFTSVEDTTILKVDKRDELDVQLIKDKQIGVPWARGMRKDQQRQTHQPVSHIEDSTILSVDKLVMEEMHQQEVAVGWRRGPKPAGATLAHVEDSTTLSVQKTSETETEVKQQQEETAVAWRRGRQPKRSVPTSQTAEVTHVEDSSILKVDESQREEVTFEETPVAWRRGGRKEQPQLQTVQHIEDSTLLNVTASEETELLKSHEQEVAVPWLRGQKKRQPTEQTIQHTEDSSTLKLAQSETEQVKPQITETAVPWLRSKKQQAPKEPEAEVPVAWERGKKKKPTIIEQKPAPIVAQQTEKQEPNLEEPETVVVKTIPLPEIQTKTIEPVEELEEKPTAWVRGKKVKPQEKPVEEKQWPTGKQKPKPEEVSEEIALKPVPKQKPHEEKPEQIILKPVSPKTIQPEQPQTQPETVEPIVIDKPISEEEPQEVVDVMIKKVVKKKIPQDRRRLPSQTLSVEEVSPDKEVEEIIQPTPQVADIKPKKQAKKKPKEHKPSSFEQSFDEEESVNISQIEVPEEHHMESVVSDEITETVESSEPLKQFILKEVNEEVDVIEKKSIQIKRTKQPEEITEELPITEQQTEQLEPTEIPETLELATVKDVVVEQKREEKVVTKKSSKKRTKQPQEVTEDLPIEDQPMEQVEPVEITEVLETANVEDVTVQHKPKTKRTKQPKEEAEELPIVSQPMEQLEPIEIPETNETVAVEDVTILQKADKKKKKKKTKTTKQVMFNDEPETFEAEAIDDESSEEVVIEEVTESSIQLRQKTIEEPQLIEEEIVIDEQDEQVFQKEMQVKTISKKVKKERRQVIVDDGQPLPELELISQKRVQQGIDKVAEEEVIEDSVVKEIVEETITHTTLPETIGLQPKPVVKAPRFLKKLQPAICQPDAPTVLQCKIDGAPYPEIRWYFNDIELFASEKYIFNVTEKVATLEIVRVTPMDVGVYSCQAKNEAGVATSRTNIVLGKSCAFILITFDLTHSISHEKVAM